MNDWMQVKVLTTTAGADLVSEILLEAGSEGTMIEDRNDVFENQRPEGAVGTSLIPQSPIASART